MKHIPVLLNEVIEYLNPKTGDCVIDATAGTGGHTVAIADRVGSEGRVLAIDWDSSALLALPKQNNIIPIHGSFANLGKIIQAHDCADISGTLFDFGFSSIQIEESGRGFSFGDSSYEEPLDMRFDVSDRSRKTAAEVLATYSENKLAELFREYGEERYAKGIAFHIAKTRKERPLHTVSDLVERIREITPIRAQHARIHFATRIFQALRIEVNSELENITEGLLQARDVLIAGGGEKPRIVAISFHSLEDRIVKHMFRLWQKDGIADILTKKPIVATEAELQKNPRARSAKLRAVEFHNI